MSRRNLLLAGAGFSLAASLRTTPTFAAAKAGDYRITVAPAKARLLGGGHPATDVWAYNASIPGPVLRLKQGEPARIIVNSRLDENTTVHCHGIRLPIAMDGVPGLTQPPIQPGEAFTYAFTPPDAGTFWYHSHTNSLEQLGRGLSGVLIVEEPEPVSVDRDLIWMVADWRLGPDGTIAPGFGNSMEATMAGRTGSTITLNGAVPSDQAVRAGERIRLRLVNGGLARIIALRFEGHRPVIVAVDGQPCDPHEPDDRRLLLGPAMRMDVVIDMLGEPGQRFAVIDDFYDGLSYTLTSLTYQKDALVRSHPLDAMMALPPNPLPEPDLVNAERHEIILQGGMMGAGMMSGLGGMHGIATPGMNGQAAWAINGMSMTGDGQANMAPLLTFHRGQSVILNLRNETAWWHPMHFHGHSLRMLTRNGVSVPHRQWQDTILLAPRDEVECAFVADNPGDWMLHCHVMDHQMAGLMAILRVA
jgi:FtsP/CotA-like multicopper oxidase with cupredoxin domain